MKLESRQNYLSQVKFRKKNKKLEGKLWHAKRKQNVKREIRNKAFKEKKSVENNFFFENVQ